MWGNAKVRVECSNADCFVSVHLVPASSEADAISLWNRRAAASAKPSGEDAANGAIGEREAFEHWCKTHCGLCDRDLHQTIAGAYRSGYVDDMWDGWQARAALTAEKVAGQDPVARCFRCGHAEHHGSCVNVAPVALNDPNKLRAALQHIERTAQRSREQSRRLRWIELRARSALDGTDDWKVLKLPKNGEHVRRKLQYRIDELQSAVAAPQQPTQSAEQDGRALMDEQIWQSLKGIADSHIHPDDVVEAGRALLTAAQPVSGGKS
jgi:hypothetical protein